MGGIRGRWEEVFLEIYINSNCLQNLFNKMLERNPEVEQLSNLCDAVVPRVLLENNTS